MIITASSVKSEKPQEYKIRFMHCDAQGKAARQNQIKTVCNILDKDSEEVVCTATATKHPNDHFVKAKGRKISLQKALKLFQVPLEDRLVIWHDYFDFFGIGDMTENPIKL